jgi:hypothetical protein
MQLAYSTHASSVEYNSEAEKKLLRIVIAFDPKML